jgi:hypothetical protein
VKRTLQDPHGVTFQKTTFFIVTAVKTSDHSYVITCWSGFLSNKLKERSLCLTKHYTMKTYGEWMSRSTFSLTLVTFEWAASSTGRFTSGERGRDTHEVGWVGSRAGVDDVE